LLVISTVLYDEELEDLAAPSAPGFLLRRLGESACPTAAQKGAAHQDQIQIIGWEA